MLEFGLDVIGMFIFYIFLLPLAGVLMLIFVCIPSGVGYEDEDTCL